MIDTAKRQQAQGIVVFCLCMSALLFFRMLPLSTFRSSLPGPELELCLAFVWILRRPDQLPAIVIVLAFLIEDVMLFRPPGLWAAFVLMGTEAARSREGRWRDQPFMLEWLRVAMLMGAMVLGYRFVQFLFLLPVPALGQVLLQYIATIAAYPIVAFGARWLIGLRRISPAEAETMRYAR